MLLPLIEKGTSQSFGNDNRSIFTSGRPASDGLDRQSDEFAEAVAERANARAKANRLLVAAEEHVGGNGLAP